MPPTISIDRSQVDEANTIRVWDIPSKMWNRVPTVDAREMVTRGTASFHGPDTVMVAKDGSEITVTLGEVKAYAAQGYVVKGEEPEQPKTPRRPEGIDWSKYSFEQLKAFAGEAGVEVRRMDKSAIVAALEKTGFKPPVTQE